MDCCDFLTVFLSDIFSTGKSAKSLVTDVIDVIRTFQKMSAPTTFYVHISKDFDKMFQWATNLLEKIFNLCGNPSFSELEQFNIFTFAIPLSIFTFISALLLGNKFLLYLLFIAFAVSFVVGIFIIFSNINIGIGLIIGSIVLIIIFIIIACKKGLKNIFQIKNDMTALYFLSFGSAFVVFAVLLIPSLYDKFRLTFIIFASFGVFLFFEISIEIIVEICYYKDESIGYKVIGLAFNIFSLSIVPSTKAFFMLIYDPQFIKWNIILAYTVIILLLPLVFSFMMILSEHSDLKNKYKDTPYYFFELIDNVKQIIYIFFAQFNIIWGCISCDIVWIILIIAIRPYNAISDYFLETCTSLFLMISNGLLFHANKHNEMFSLKTQVALFLMGIIPAIVSFFIYFIFDFGKKMDDDDDSNEDSLQKLGIIISFSGPIIWIICALNVENIIAIF